MRGKSLMFQGTGSSVGKSMLCAAVLRILRQDGLKVAPFKAQNMALNSYATSEGLEMGRAQVTQAEAAGMEPSVRMNPVLLKPTSDRRSQVIVNGKSVGVMSAMEYEAFKPRLRQMVRQTYDALESSVDVVVIEGAGSPAEINLKQGDIVNMSMAAAADAPVILIGDINPGGVFAALYGTVKLLPPDEQRRIKGIVVNKFRGDVKILEPGLKMLEDLLRIPVIGVVPWVDIDIEDEDSVTERFSRLSGQGQVRAAIVRLPHISNFTDFHLLGCEAEEGRRNDSQRQKSFRRPVRYPVAKCNRFRGSHGDISACVYAASRELCGCNVPEGRRKKAMDGFAPSCCGFDGNHHLLPCCKRELDFSAV